MADLTADQLGKSNSMTRAQAAGIAADNSQHARAVIEADGVNINRELIDQGYGRFRKDLGGAEEQAIY
jgi:hypothetical protein